VREYTQHCIAHGGGRRCQHEGCTKAPRGDTQYCIAHGGGRRCQKEGCAKSAADVPHAALHRARRGQAVPARGLLQVSRKSSRQRVLHAMSVTRTARRCGGAVTLTHDRHPSCVNASRCGGWCTGRVCTTTRDPAGQCIQALTGNLYMPACRAQASQGACRRVGRSQINSGDERRAEAEA
jgi:hypothetical protein